MKRAEVLTIVAALLGWGLFTWGIAEWSQVVWVWPISTGILLLGLVGFRLIWQVLMDGVYLLSQHSDEEDGG